MESPRASRLARPRWRDARLLAGVLLVITSVVVGSRVLAGADHSQRVWSASRDLAAGIQLTGADLSVRAVRLDASAQNYLLESGFDPVGRVLTRPVSAGDLLPAGALTTSSGEADQRREVTVPVTALHYPPDLTRGSLVDVYVTSGAAASAGPDLAAAPSAVTVPDLVLAGALVVDVADGGSGLAGPSASVGVVLSVPADRVADLVAGIRAGPVDLVMLPGS